MEFSNFLKSGLSAVIYDIVLRYCASYLLPSGEKGELGAVGCVYTTSYIEEFKVLTRTDVLPHDLYVFISITSRVFMQKAQSMLQFMLNYSFPHATSFHHRDSLPTSYSPIVGPAAERGIEQQQKTYEIFIGRQAKRQNREPYFTHLLWEWKDSSLSIHCDIECTEAKVTMAYKRTKHMIIDKSFWKTFVRIEAPEF